MADTRDPGDPDPAAALVETTGAVRARVDELVTCGAELEQDNPTLRAAVGGERR